MSKKKNVPKKKMSQNKNCVKKNWGKKIDPKKGLYPKRAPNLSPNMSLMFCRCRYLKIRCTDQIWSETVENCSIYDLFSLIVLVYICNRSWPENRFCTITHCLYDNTLFVKSPFQIILISRTKIRFLTVNPSHGEMRKKNLTKI